MAENMLFKSRVQKDNIKSAAVKKKKKKKKTQKPKYLHEHPHLLANALLTIQDCAVSGVPLSTFNNSEHGLSIQNLE